MKLLYATRDNFSQFAWQLPFANRYGGLVYCPDATTFQLVRAHHPRLDVTPHWRDVLRYRPNAVLYTMYSPLPLPCAHIQLGHCIEPFGRGLTWAYDRPAKDYLNFDLIVCAGRWDRDNHAVRSNPGRFEVLGFPRLDAFRVEPRSFDGARPTILYAPQGVRGWSSLSRWAGVIEQLSRSFDVLVFAHYLLVRDAREREAYRNLMRRQHSGLRVVARNPELHRALAESPHTVWTPFESSLSAIEQCDLVITDRSTIMMEAIALEKPLVLTHSQDGAGRVRLRRPDVEALRAEVARKIAMRDLRVDIPCLDFLESWDKHYIFHRTDGGATERVMAAIRAVVEDASPARHAGRLLRRGLREAAWRTPLRPWVWGADAPARASHERQSRPWSEEELCEYAGEPALQQSLPPSAALRQRQ